jgi:hypothetical protein
MIFFPASRAAYLFYYPVKVDPSTFEPMEAGLQLSPLSAYAHEVPHYYLQKLRKRYVAS